jgi:ABC-2 type transport system permease protein
MRYAVDLVRSIFYVGRPEYAQVVLLNPFINLLVIGILFVLFLSIGTTVFVRSERNR